MKQCPALSECSFIFNAFAWYLISCSLQRIQNGIISLIFILAPNNPWTKTYKKRKFNHSLSIKEKFQNNLSNVRNLCLLLKMYWIFFQLVIRWRQVQVKHYFHLYDRFSPIWIKLNPWWIHEELIHDGEYIMGMCNLQP